MSTNRDIAEETAHNTDTEHTAAESARESSDAKDDASGVQEEDPTPVVATTPTHAPSAAQPNNIGEISAQLRESAAEIAEITAQAARLGIAIDAAKALRDGTAPEALRRLVLDQASAAADARDIVAAPPSPVLPKSTESPIVAAAKKAASAGSRG